MEGFQHLDVFKGVKDNDEGVVALVLIGEQSSGEVRVIEKRRVLDGGKPTSAFETAEYVKPLSEISEELNGGVLTRAGKQAPSVEKARRVLSN